MQRQCRTAAGGAAFDQVFGVCCSPQQPRDAHMPPSKPPIAPGLIERAPIQACTNSSGHWRVMMRERAGK
jgi:hypothetical protein